MRLAAFFAVSRCRRVEFDVEVSPKCAGFSGQQFDEKLRKQQESQTMTDADALDSRCLFLEGC